MYQQMTRLYGELAESALRLKAMEAALGHRHIPHISRKDEEDDSETWDGSDDDGDDDEDDIDLEELSRELGIPIPDIQSLLPLLPPSHLVMGDNGKIYQITDPVPTPAKVPDTWANPDSVKFEDHFKLHGTDFGAKTPAEYAAKANEFYNIGQAEKFPMLETSEGWSKIYDPETNTFGVYDPEGKTETFFKPSSDTYFERQIENELSKGGRVIEPLPITEPVPMIEPALVEDPVFPEIFIP